MTSDNLIKETLQTSKIIAMVGASVPKENEAVAKMRLKPSIIVCLLYTSPSPRD